MGISAKIGGLSPSDLLGQPHWDRIAAYSQRWAESLAVYPPSSISEQERLLTRLLTVWLTAAASAGVRLPAAGPLFTQQGAAAQLKPLLPPFLSDFTLSTQGSPLKDGRWGLLDGHLAWQNWGGSLPPARLGRLLVPHTPGEVAAAVSAAAAAGRRVRAVGKGHTWTPMFFDADGDTDVIFTTLLRLPSGQRIEMAGLSASGAPLVRIAAGVTAGELSQYVTDHAADLGNAALPADVVIESVRYAGVISMGCHGSSKDFGAIPDFVESLTAINGRGQPVVYDVTHAHFSQARTALGLMGIITEITMRLASVEHEPDKPFVTMSYSYNAMNNLFGPAGSPAKLKALVERHYSIELFWWSLNNASIKGFLPAAWDPYADRLMVYMTDRAAAPEGTLPTTYSSKTDVVANLETALGYVATSVGMQTGNLAVQALAPRLIFQTLQSLINRSGLMTLPAAIHYGRGAVDQFKIYDFEMYFRVDADFAVPFAAWNAAVTVAREMLVERSSNALNVALEARFIAQSAVVMSPAYHTGDALFFCVEITAVEGTPGWSELQQRVFNAWTGLNGTLAPPKPHWAKWTNFGQSSAGNDSALQPGLSVIDKYAQQVFAEQIAAFKPAVAAADPKGVFRNSWLAAMFGLVGK
ncbi:hypothetical protein WJX81_004351 [Elliptochloris bilobata]|uniref:FAD-binding PCMH-type domain-containing protein n=1 Tax=Elliptochloris bilobata TaxID=381761 RepID=A0AAW1RSW9_9CHLO